MHTGVRRPDMAFVQQRVFMRSGVEEEEITPPCMKSRSFDSLSVAHILQAKLDPTASSKIPMAAMPPPLGVANEHAPPGSPGSPKSSPGSPTIDAAAAVLHTVQHGAVMDKAVDCLMSLAGAAASSSSMGVTSHAGSKRHASQIGGADGAGGTRRRLKMRAGQQAAQQAARPRWREPVGSRQQHASTVLEAAPPQNSLQVAGVRCPVRILSGASLQQLKLLSAAFKLCPSPNPQQIAAIARRVAVSPEKLETWFQSRRVRAPPPAPAARRTGTPRACLPPARSTPDRAWPSPLRWQTLQEWMTQQPHLQPADLARMFYPEAAETGPSPPPATESSLPDAVIATASDLAAALAARAPPVPVKG